jgi:hypothetical protein
MVQRLELTLVLVTLLVLSVTSAASAETWICSVQEIVECSDDGKCGPPDFGGVQPATFFQIDTDRKLVTLLAPEERRGETTEIHSLLAVEDGWLLAGVEIERAWSLVISGNGDLTISITMEGATWTGFGKCMPAEHANP